jgi:hypothetical protein
LAKFSWTFALDEICARPQISAQGASKGRVANFLHLVDIMGHVEVAISMALAEAGNVKTVTIGRPEGNNGGEILGDMKTSLHACCVGLVAGLFLPKPHAAPMSLVFGDLRHRPLQLGATTWVTSALVVLLE